MNRANESVQTASSLGDLIDLLSTRVAAERRIVWYRGHRSAIWHVEPTIWRDDTPYDERNLTNRFRARASTRHQAPPDYDNYAFWVSLMQHYGLPTRLLDWTRSPLVAVYFAVEDYIYARDVKPEDAVIWVLEPHILNELENLALQCRLKAEIEPYCWALCVTMQVSGNHDVVVGKWKNGRLGACHAPKLFDSIAHS